MSFCSNFVRLIVKLFLGQIEGKTSRSSCTEGAPGKTFEHLVKRRVQVIHQNHTAHNEPTLVSHETQPESVCMHRTSHEEKYLFLVPPVQVIFLICSSIS